MKYLNVCDIGLAEKLGKWLAFVFEKFKVDIELSVVADVELRFESGHNSQELPLLSDCVSIL